MANERTLASTSQLFDPATDDWAWPVIDALGLPRKIFGNIVAPGTILGPIRTEIADYIGMENIPVIASASHDTASAVAGIPMSQGDNLWLSSGTWSIMGVERKHPIRSYEALSFGFCNELGVNNTVRLLKNIAGLWLIQECKRQWDKEGENHSFAELAGMAETAEPFTAFIDPDDPVFASPGNMPGKIRDYCEKTGQAVPESLGQILRVATESLALKYRNVYGNICHLTGRTYSRLHAGGGGIQNQMLCQATANALGIEVLAGPIEATSCGNLITQMIATGDVPDFTAGRQLIRESFDFVTYIPQDREQWDKAYADFLKIIG
jgi:sugar (pentulose or hexulose) kinase